jgi:putative membrane protein (TIGR04086 family)
METKTNAYARLLLVFGKLLFASYFITGILLLCLSMLLYKFHISQSVVNIGIVVIYCLSTFFTGFLAGKSRKQKKFIWGLLLGVAYFVLLCLISLAVNSSIKDLSGNFLTSLLLCAGSGMLGGMFS